MGLGYSILRIGFSSLMLYFLLQTISSFTILVAYLLPSPVLFSAFLILKLSIFPFNFWYVRLLYRFPNSLFFLASTFHKLPPLLLVYLFSVDLHFPTLWASILFTMFISSSIMITSSDLRLTLIRSSVGNNSWFIMALLSGLHVFRVFFVVYCTLFYIVVRLFGRLSNLPRFSPKSMLYVTALRGIPPSPLFFMKMLVLFSLFINGTSPQLVMAVLPFAALLVCGYVYSNFSKLVLSFGRPLSLSV